MGVNQDDLLAVQEVISSLHVDRACNLADYGNKLAED